jgi:hypothetical protein
MVSKSSHQSKPRLQPHILRDNMMMMMMMMMILYVKYLQLQEIKDSPLLIVFDSTAISSQAECVNPSVMMIMQFITQNMKNWKPIQ